MLPCWGIYFICYIAKTGSVAWVLLEESLNQTPSVWPRVIQDVKLQINSWYVNVGAKQCCTLGAWAHPSLFAAIFFNCSFTLHSYLTKSIWWNNLGIIYNKQILFLLWKLMVISLLPAHTAVLQCMVYYYHHHYVVTAPQHPDLPLLLCFALLAFSQLIWSICILTSFYWQCHF